MKIGIDTFGCDHGKSGFGAYLYYLTNNLVDDKNVEYDFFGQEVDRYTYKTPVDHTFTAVNTFDSIEGQRTWHVMKFNKFARRQKYDVVFFPASTRIFPLYCCKKSVAVVNDIVSAKLSNSREFYLRSLVLGSLKKVDAIIAASNYIKEDLVKYGFKSGKIHVIPHGVDHSLFYQHPADSTDFVDVKPFAIKRPYIIYPSRISAESKKHIQLIRAFNAFKDKYQTEHRLVLAGNQDAYIKEIEKEVLSSKYASDIFLTGFFPHESFAKLYTAADACIFPSVEEGVGLPVLEAMASGIPVACAARGALPEIAGGKAVLFDPDDEQDFLAALEKVITDQQLRGKLIEEGLVHAKQFTWEKTALATFKLCSSLVH